MDDSKQTGGLEVQPVKMARKVSFRDEKKQEPIADVHMVPSNKNIYNHTEGGCLSCIKCQIF